MCAEGAAGLHRGRRKAGAARGIHPQGIPQRPIGPDPGDDLPHWLAQAAALLSSYSSLTVTLASPHQAENVLQLLQARTAAAADSALAGLTDGVGRIVSDMRAECLQLLAELEVNWNAREQLCDLVVGLWTLL